MRFLLVILVLATLPAHAADHLEPEASVYSSGGPVFLGDYDELVVTVLRGAYAREVQARVIIIPSFSPERALGVALQEGGYRIFGVQLEQHLWAYKTAEFLDKGETRIVRSNDGKTEKEEAAEIRKNLPQDFKDVKLTKCEMAVNADMGKRLVELWRKMLLGTRFSPAACTYELRTNCLHHMLDGTSYHFSMRTSGMALAGQTQTPYEAPKLEKFIGITELMERACTQNNAGLLPEIDRRAKALSRRVN